MKRFIIAKAFMLASALCVAAFAQAVGGPGGGPGRGGPGPGPGSHGSSSGNTIAAYVFGAEEAKNSEELAALVVTNLAQSSKYSEPRRGAREFYAMADREQRKKHGRLLEDRDFCKIGDDYGVDYLCIIDVEKNGRQNSVWARILDLGSRRCEVVATAEFSGFIRNNAEVRTAANELTRELLNRRMNKRSITVSLGGGGVSVSVPAPPPPPPPPPPRGNQIAAYVYGIEQAKLGEDLSNSIVDGLAADRKYSAAKRGAREFYRKADQEQRKKGGRLLGDRDFCKIGSDYGVEYLCIIDIEKNGRQNSVWARILDLETCQIIATAESTALIRNDAEVTAVSNQIVRELTHRRIGQRSIHR